MLSSQFTQSQILSILLLINLDMDELEAYLPEDLDEDDITKTTEEVKEILKENDKQAKMNMNQVLDEFAQKQTESNEQPVEVGDNEEESVKDSDESDGENCYLFL